MPLPLVKTLREEFGISVKEAKDALLKANLDVYRARSILKGEASAPSSPALTAAKTVAKTVVTPLAQLKEATSKEAALAAEEAALLAGEARLVAE